MRSTLTVSPSLPALTLGLVLALAPPGCAADEGAPGGGPPASSSGTVAPAAKRANGTVGPWQAQAAMPVARGNHCAAYAGGWLVVVGGNYKPKGASQFKNVAEVHAAKVADDGTLGPWQLAGMAPSAVSSCTMAASGTDLLIVDGIFEKETDGKQVWRATIDAGGALSAWRSLAPLPDGVRVLYSVASVTDGQLVAGFARLSNDGDAVSVLSASYKDGALGPFTESKVVSGFRGHPQYAFTASHAYVLGGYGADTGGQGNPVSAEGFVATLGGGKAVDSRPTRSLPKPTAFGEAIAVDDYVLVIGGKDAVFQGTGRTSVYSARIGSDGALGEYTEAEALPQGRTALAVTLGKDFVYVTGGGFDAGGLDTVYAARVRY